MRGYGRVHPDIRRAAREKRISLDVMKAFASHPDHGTQWAVYEAIEGSYRQAWTIRDRLEKAGVKVGSDLGRYVETEYRAADGPITADLIVEDSVLTDEVLVERLLIEKLTALAEAERKRLGFAWAEGRRTADYQALRAYGRTYPSPIEPEGAAAERVTAIADRLLAIDALRETYEAGDEAEANDDGTGFDALEDEYEALQQEHEELTTDYSAEQLAQSGVIAHWAHGGPQVIHGLIRPEDLAASRGEAAPAGASAGGESEAGGTQAPGAVDGADEIDGGTAPLEVAASLAADLRTERAIVIGAGLAADPALAQDLALFVIVADLWDAHGTRVSWSMGVTANRGERPHGKPDGMDQGPAEAIAALREGLDLSWTDGARSVTERFERFRLLDAEMKARIVGVAMAEAIAPSEMAHGETLLTHVAHQVVPDMRAAWRPTGEAFFGRIRKAQLLHLLATDLKQPEEAARLATAKKVDVVDHLDRLFAAPFATLSPEQREAVETWCPPGMELPELRERHRVPSADEPAILEHRLSEDERAIYDRFARAFKVIHRNLHCALEATGITDEESGASAGAAKASALSRFESMKQRFFGHVLNGFKAGTLIRAIEDDLAHGWAPVVQIVSTGESHLDRALEGLDGDDLTQAHLTPKEAVIHWLRTAFPVQAHQLVEVEGVVVAERLTHADGSPVISREAEALRDAALMELYTTAPIPSVLDRLVWHFGEARIAEVTGRSKRSPRLPGGALKVVPRSAQANSAEAAAFMAGTKAVLLFTDAGGTGRSYHAAATAGNRDRRRRHYLVEPGWRAAEAIQALGRTHRSAQVTAPWFRVVTTDVHGEKRFTSTIARRLDTLGALTRGQRQTGSQNLFRASDNLESPIARRALVAHYGDLVRGTCEGCDPGGAMDYETFEDWTALRLVDADGVMYEELPPIQRYLNRLLALPIDMQNALFGALAAKIEQLGSPCARAGSRPL